MRNSTVTVSLVLVLVCWATTWEFALADVFGAKTQQIKQWINDLDHNDYQRREQGTRSLVAAGRPAINLVLEAALDGGPEVSWRAASILEQIGLSGDEETLAAVVAGMEQLGRSGKTGLGRSRNELSAKWCQLRHQRAVSKLQQLGARIDDASNRWGFAADGFGARFVMDAMEAVIPADVEAAADDAIAVGALADIPVAIFPPNMEVAGEFIFWDADRPAGTVRIVTLDNAWQGMDNDWKLLADLDKVTTLALNDLNLNEKDVEQIARMPHLRRLTITHCGFDRDSVLDLKRTKPQLSIYATGPTILGVSGETDGQGFRISHVVPGSGAEEAGIRTGDLITSVDNLACNSLDELTLIIAPKRVGDRLDVQILRNDKPLDKVVALGRRS